MANITLVTDYVSPDEKAYRLAELVFTPFALSKGGRRFKPHSMSGVKRWEIIWVNRGDKLAQHIRDMGPASAFSAGPVNIFALWEHTVAELRDIAERWRDEQSWERSILANRQGESRLIEQFVKEAEIKQKHRRGGQSVFGPAITVQRVGVRRG